MKFIATDDQNIGVTFEAPNWDEAERICDIEDWELAGQLVAVLPGETPAAHVEAMVDQLNSGSPN